MAARCDRVVRWSLLSLSTHTSHDAPGWTSLVVGRAERCGAFTMVGQAPRGVMVLRVIKSIAEKAKKVKFF